MSQLIIIWDKVDYGELLREKIPHTWNWRFLSAENFSQAFAKHMDWDWQYVIFLRGKALLLANINTDLVNIFRDIPHNLRIMVDWRGKYNCGLISAHRDVWKLFAGDLERFAAQHGEYISLYFGEKISDVMVGYSGDFIQLTEACKILAHHLNIDQLGPCAPIISSVFSALCRGKLRDANTVNWQIFSRFLSEITSRQINQQLVLQDWEDSKQRVQNLMEEAKPQEAYEILQRMSAIFGNFSNRHAWLFHLHTWILGSLPETIMTMSEKRAIIENFVFRNYPQLLSEELFVNTLSNLQFFAQTLHSQKISHKKIRINNCYWSGDNIFFADEKGNKFLANVVEQSLTNIQPTRKITPHTLLVQKKEYSICADHKQIAFYFSGKKGYSVYGREKYPQLIGQCLQELSVPWCINFHKPSNYIVDEGNFFLAVSAKISQDNKASVKNSSGKYIFLVICLDSEYKLIRHSHVYTLQFLPIMGINKQDRGLLVYALSEQGEIINGKITEECWYN